MKTNLIITIPVNYSETVAGNNFELSGTQKKLNDLKPILSALFGCASPTISAGIQFLPIQDEKISEICKQMSGKLFEFKDIEKARQDFDRITRERCYQPIKIIIIKEPIRIIQQETGGVTGVQQHARRPGTERTFCGVKFLERERWCDHGEDVEAVDAQRSVSCMVCMKGIRKYNRDNKK